MLRITFFLEKQSAIKTPTGGWKMSSQLTTCLIDRCKPTYTCIQNTAVHILLWTAKQFPNLNTCAARYF